MECWSSSKNANTRDSLDPNSERGPLHERNLTNVKIMEKKREEKRGKNRSVHTRQSCRFALDPEPQARLLVCAEAMPKHVHAKQKSVPLCIVGLLPP